MTNKSMIVSFLALIVIAAVSASPANVNVYKLVPETIFTESEDGEYYIFGMGYDIVADKTGAFYILDGKELCVKKFGADGKFVTKFGKPGQGPGELFYPRDIQLLGDKILIIQFDKLHIFNLDGSLVETRARDYNLFDSTERNIKFYSSREKFVFTGDDVVKELFFLKIVDSSKKIDKIIESIDTGKTSFSPRKNEMIIIFNMDIFFDVDDHGTVVFARDGDNRDLKIYRNEKTQVVYKVKGLPVSLPSDILKEEEMHFKAGRNQGLNYPEKKNYSFITDVSFAGDDIMLRIRTKERTGWLRLSRAGVEKAFYAEDEDTAKISHTFIHSDAIYYLINDRESGVIVKRAKLK